ncbi:MAG: N-acetyltransferase family protein [Actinomycetota bacterium]|nr:N-acetyltransferase family protein [Actinomycetota bacterium]
MDEPSAVRPAVPADCTAIAAVYRPYVVAAAASFEEAAPAPGEMERRMLAEPRLPWLVADRGGDVVGYCYASRHRERAAYRWSADVSVYCAREERGRGTGRRLYGALLPELAALGYVRAYAGIVLPNPASVRLHEALGFVAVGVYRDVGYKHGAWRDVGWWQRALADPPAVPVEPRPWAPGR